MSVSVAAPNVRDSNTSVCFRRSWPSSLLLDVSADGQTAAIQPFSLSKQMLLGSIVKGIPCSTLHHFKEDASQAAARIVREATEKD